MAHVLRFLALLLALMLATAPAAAEPLRWTGDREGGGPFVYPNGDGSDEVIGFEVELAGLVAKARGVDPNFVQGAWTTLPEMLATHKADLVLNGMEWSPALADRFDTSVPY